MTPIIYTENLNRSFVTRKQAVYVLKNINIKVQPNTLTILKGKSGSGKTTLINLLGALDSPTSGKIYFKDHETTALSSKKLDSLRRSNMGFIFQSFALISLMSAYENVEFALRIADYNSRDAKLKAEECLEMVGLTKRMHHRPQEMSGGEQQRVAIARAMAHKPSIIFADEPTAELDAHNSIHVMKLFRDLVKDKGITIVMTTHDPNIMELGDYVITLQDGEVIDEKWNIEYEGDADNGSM